MTISRKHFDAIASAIADVNALPIADPVTVAMIARHLGIELKQFNPNFQLENFMEACTAKPKMDNVHPLTITNAKEFVANDTK